MRTHQPAIVRMLQATEGKLQRLKGKDMEDVVRSKAKPNLIVSVGGRVGGWRSWMSCLYPF